MTLEFIVCAGCAGGDAVAASVGAACPDVPVRRVDCMSVCDAPVTLAARSGKGATYVFAGIGPHDAGDVAAFAAAYRSADAGWIEDARPLGEMRFRLVTRVPGALG